MEFVDGLEALVQTVGMWAVFAVLYVQERRSHDSTRRLWNDDLREIAGLTKPLQNARSTVDRVDGLYESSVAE